MKENILIGNGINIQHKGYEFTNASIILRTLKNYESPDFPKHILIDEPILAKCYFGQLFSEVKAICNGEYDLHTNCTAEKRALKGFKDKYGDKISLKITDIGFEDYYLIHDLVCHKIRLGNPDQYNVRESMKWSFLHAIYNNGSVNCVAEEFTQEFIDWLNEFDNIFTLNYDENIEIATGKQVYHLHGDFSTRQDIYMPESFRNQLSDRPIDDSIIDENNSHLYSIAVSTHCGDYKESLIKQHEMANSAVKKMAEGYISNPDIKKEIDEWINEDNELVSRLGESIKLKVENPELEYTENYPIEKFEGIDGELIILGLSPYNDLHLFELINNSKIDKCIFYYFDETEKDIVRNLLHDTELEFINVNTFWKQYATVKLSKKAPKGKKNKIKFKNIARVEFKKFAECFRELSFSIMTDNNIVREFNKTSVQDRKEIVRKIKQLKVEEGYTSDQQLILNMVDIHMIAEEYGIDPAVVLLIGTDNSNNEYIRLK
jgi:hypothetical protein